MRTYWRRVVNDEWERMHLKKSTDFTVIFQRPEDGKPWRMSRKTFNNRTEKGEIVVVNCVNVMMSESQYNALQELIKCIDIVIDSYEGKTIDDLARIGMDLITFDKQVHPK